MKQIPLTQGQFALVDDEDFERINAFKWSARKAPQARTFRALRNSTANEGGSRHIVFLHHEILSPVLGYVVDHVNRDTLDNRRENLRLCTQKHNSQNRGMRIGSASPFKGITLRPNGTWHAQIQVDGKKLSLGYFRSPKDAALAYDSAATRYFGDFAQTNRMLGLL